MCRTVRWLDRCIAAHKRPSEQNLFPIVQGGLDADLRVQCAKGVLMMLQIKSIYNYVYKLLYETSVVLEPNSQMSLRRFSDII